MQVILQRLEAGQGEAIILLHGVGSDATAWAPQIEALPGHRVAFDMPGYRGSQPASTTDAADLARLVLGSSPKQARLHLVGLSLGAIVAAHAAALAVDRVASLTLASGFLAYPDGHKVAQTAAAAAAEHGMAVLAQKRTPRLLAAPASHALRESIQLVMARIPVDAYQRMSAAVWQADLRAVAPLIEAPTLVVSGQQDLVTPPSMGRLLSESIRGASFHVLPDAGHLVNLEQPEAFNALVRLHLAESP